MKKYLFVLIFTLSFFICNIGVKASSFYDLEVHNINHSVSDSITHYKNYNDIYLNLFNDVYSTWKNSNYSDLPYYLISVSVSGSCINLSNCSYSDVSVYLTMYLFHSIPSFYFNGSSLHFSGSASYEIVARYDFLNSTYVMPYIQNNDYLNFINYNTYFYSNFNLIYNSTDSSSLVLRFNGFNDSIYTLNNGDTLIPMHDYFNLDILSDPDNPNSSYIDVDLNKYSYVALSLKDYDVESFESIMYVKGQLCPTQVYNYGMNSKDSYQNGTQISSRCNLPYSNFTPVRFYISDLDLSNHSIYYLKSYDTSIENIIKIDSNIFNIHYISEQEKDNPILNINGRNYSTIPYDELPSTATKNEEENYVPGASEQITFESFFDKPLEALKSVWGAIVSIFSIIGEFIILLPPTMQGFLYISFGIAIVLGIIKILL